MEEFAFIALLGSIESIAVSEKIPADVVASYQASTSHVDTGCNKTKLQDSGAAEESEGRAGSNPIEDQQPATDRPFVSQNLLLINLIA